MQRPEEQENDWAGWVSASATHHWTEMDPLVDWLRAYGKQAGFVPDRQRPEYDKRFDYVAFVLEQSSAFEKAVIGWISTMSPVRTIATSQLQTRTLAKAQQTVTAMREGVPIIGQAVLWNADDRMDGMVDLLVRSDTLQQLSPAAYAGEPTGAAQAPAPALGSVSYHYRAIDIKFANLQLTQGGEASRQHLPYMVQNWVYNEALGKTQGYTPPASYLLGRDLFKALARVSHDNAELRRLALKGAAWIRRVVEEGASWRALPVPSIPELRPNMKAWEDLNWHEVKREIAETQHDLTLLPYVNPQRRALAIAAGISRWDDPSLSASLLGLDSQDGRRIDAVLRANRSGGGALYPPKIVSQVGNWRDPAPVECFVMVESVSDQADDFSRLAGRNSAATTYMITWSWFDRKGDWRSRQLVAHDLSLSAEADLEQVWRADLEELAGTAGVGVQDVRLIHWGVEGNLPLPDLDWYDLLQNLILREPIAVRGALGFGLVEMAGALHDLGLIATAIPPLPPGPLPAMAAAFWSAKEAGRLGIPLEQVEPIQTIGNNNLAACRSMMEILTLLRKRH